MKRTLLACGLVLALLPWAPEARAFCGFYVAQAGGKLFNRASHVVLVRDGERTVITMASDYRGEPDEFALVVPVPSVLERSQIHVGDPGLVERIDAYTAPRLVEYHDADPCGASVVADRLIETRTSSTRQAVSGESSARVRIEAEYTVGEYDIVILSAEESDALSAWLEGHGYRIPPDAGPILRSYLRQGMKFFVARVNLAEKEKLGYRDLRPIQLAFESSRFRLPIRLGTVNADGPQELFVYALTRQGRVETTNYRTVKIPTDAEIPPYVEEEFDRFYRDLFSRQVRKHRRRAVFLEYAWAMNQCDPCADRHLTMAELRRLGVFWLPEPGARRRPQPRSSGTLHVFVTRLHLRYDRSTFPEDLQLQVTSNRESFQGRYVIRHPWIHDTACREGEAYRRALRDRQEREVDTLAELTGWERSSIRERVRFARADDPEPLLPWWERLWPN